MPGRKRLPAAPPPSLDAVLDRLRAQANPDNVAGMARFGITPQTQALGVSMPFLRNLGQEIGPAPDLARQLWRSGLHEARILATLIHDPAAITRAELEDMAASLDTWDVCDQFCGNLAENSPLAWELAQIWAGRDELFVKRAGFSLMARLAVSAKKAPDSAFPPFLTLIARESGDGRNFVMKAVNWALRQIGKRSLPLRELALATAKNIQATDTRSGRWIASGAIRELHDPKILARMRQRAGLP